METVLDAHYWILQFIYPVVNLVFIVYSLRAIREGVYKKQFTLVLVSCIATLLVAMLRFGLKLNRELELNLISRDFAPIVFITDGFLEYTFIVLNTIGFVWLVRALMRDKQSAA